MNLPLIEINLSEEFRRKKGGLTMPQKQLPLAIGGAVFFVLLVVGGVWTVATIRNAQVTSIEQQVRVLSNEVAIVVSTLGVSSKLKEQIKELENYRNDRVEMSERLHSVASNMPNKVYLTDVTYDATDPAVRRLTLQARAFGSDVDDANIPPRLTKFFVREPLFSNAFSSIRYDPENKLLDEWIFSIVMERTNTVVTKTVTKPAPRPKPRTTATLKD